MNFVKEIHKNHFDCLVIRDKNETPKYIQVIRSRLSLRPYLFLNEKESETGRSCDLKVPIGWTKRRVSICVDEKGSAVLLDWKMDCIFSKEITKGYKLIKGDYRYIKFVKTYRGDLQKLIVEFLLFPKSDKVLNVTQNLSTTYFSTNYLRKTTTEKLSKRWGEKDAGKINLVALKYKREVHRRTISMSIVIRFSVFILIVIISDHIFTTFKSLN